VVVHFCIPPNIPQKFRNAPYNHPMRHIVFGHQFANESLAKRPIVSPLLHMSKMIAGDFPSAESPSSRFRPAPLRLPPQLPSFFRRATDKLFALGMTGL
jgi:hypothetical protein